MQRCESGMWVRIQSGGPATGHWALSLRARGVGSCGGIVNGTF